MTAELPRIPDALAQSPASDKLVWRELDAAERPLTRRELRHRTRLTKRTVTNALKRLREADLIARAPPPADSDCYFGFTLR